MASSRLPRKIFAEILGRPALARIIDRLRRCEKIDGIVLATTSSSDDDETAAWASSEGIECVRASEDDVLGRVVAAQRHMNSDIVVEICGDCPLLDPEIVDVAVETFLANDCDVVTTTRHPSYPQGLDVQVFRLSELESIEQKISDPVVREHVSLHFYENPKYRLVNLVAPRECRAPDLRCQLDYAEDLVFIRRVYEALEPSHGPYFGAADIVHLVRAQPDLAEINSHCEERAVR